MSKKKVPDWLNEYTRDMLVVLNITNPEWRVFTKMETLDGRTTAEVNVDPTYMNATITYSPHIKPGEDAKQCVLHEGLHIVHDPVDAVIRTIFHTVPKAQRKALNTLYCDAVENFVQRLSRALMAYFVSKNAQHEKEIDELKAEIRRLSAANNDQERAGAVDRPELGDGLRELCPGTNSCGQWNAGPEFVQECDDPDIGDRGAER